MKSIFAFPFHGSQFCSLLLIPALVALPLGAQSPIAASSPAAGDTAVQSSAPANAVDNTDLQLRVVEGAGTEALINSISSKGIVVSVTNVSGAPVPDAAVALRLPDSGATGTFADGSHTTVAYTDATGKAQFTGLHWNQTPGEVAMRVTATKGTSHAALLLSETLTSAPSTTAVVHPAAAPQIASPSVTITTPQTAKAVPATAVPQPGQPAIAQPVAQSGASPAMTPIPPAKPEPTVTVTGASPDSTPHSGKTKWFIIAAVVAAGAGAGIALAGKGKSSTSTASAITIGTPSVSVGAPTH